jgi:Lrp/AsnC family leucine-responsive transcriptional regulator
LIDELDRVILGELLENARMSWRELGDRVGLGSTATADRVRRMVDLGVIRRFTTVVDPGALGIGLQAVVDVRLGSDSDPDDFESTLAHTPEVQRAVHMTGPFDYQLWLSTATVGRLDELLRAWKSDHGVSESNTRLLLNDIDLPARRAAG